MDFISYAETMGVLKHQGLREIDAGEDLVRLQLDTDEGCHLHLACRESDSAPLPGARTVTVEKARLPNVVEHVISKLHISQVLIVPVAKWRKVFDAVAFSLANNEDWQEIDASATVELNTRDPLLCGPGDLHTIHALIHALLTDAEGEDQAIMLTTTGRPFLIEVIPDGAVRISVGNPAVVDEIVEIFGE